MQRKRSLRWRGKWNRSRSVAPVVVGPDDEVVAVGVHREVAPRHRGHEPALGLRLVELGAQRRADPLLELVVGLASALSGRNCHWLRNSAVSLMYVAISSSEMPLATRGAEERRREDRDVGRRRRSAAAAIVDGVARPPAATCAAAGRGRRASRPKSGSSVAGLLALHEGVHRVEALERVLAVEEPALVDLAQVALDVGAGERGAAEQHRDLGEPEVVQLLRGSRA